MADLVPHPLVTQVALHLAQKGVDALAEAAQQLVAPFVEEEGQAGPAHFAAAAAIAADDSQYAAEKDALAKALADHADLPDLSVFVGLLGGAVERNGAESRLLYLDWRLQQSLVVPTDDIVVHQRLGDDKAPCGACDVLWVKSSATVTLASGARAAERRFLVGEFTRCGAFPVIAPPDPCSGGVADLCYRTQH